MFRKSTSSLLIVVLSILLIASSMCIYSNESIKSRSLHIVAVSRLENGSIAGVYADLKVEVITPGSGIVYISTKPLTELDIQASARVAALIAAQIAGVNYFSYNYHVYIEAPSPIVGGPSASAAMAIAIAKASLFNSWGGSSSSSTRHA